MYYIKQFTVYILQNKHIFIYIDSQCEHIYEPLLQNRYFNQKEPNSSWKKYLLFLLQPLRHILLLISAPTVINHPPSLSLRFINAIQVNTKNSSWNSSNIIRVFSTATHADLLSKYLFEGTGDAFVKNEEFMMLRTVLNTVTNVQCTFGWTLGIIRLIRNFAEH